MGKRRWRVSGVLVAVATLAAVAGCTESGSRQRSLRLGTTSYMFSITSSQAPPHAMDSILYKVVVLERKTRQPIEDGEGQIYAGHEHGPYTYDGFVYGPEVGTYYGWLRYTIPGKWNVNIRFRRDSLSPLENTDWYQDVIEQTPYPEHPGKKGS